MDSINDYVKSKKWIGKDVYVEGQFPLPLGAPGQVAYSPCIGQLVEIFTDGFAILEKGNRDPTILFRDNLRSINLVPEQSGLVLPTLPKRGGLLG